MLKNVLQHVSCALYFNYSDLGLLPSCRVQRAMLENVLRACVGLAPENNMLLEFKN